jgi:xylulokinase
MSSVDTFILAIDLGTSGPKVALFSSQGEMLGSEFEETRLLLLPDGGAEQSPDDWWDAIQNAAKRLLARGPASNEGIVAIAITGQWAGTVPVDAGGNALGNAIIWMDSRGGAQIHQIAGGAINIQGYSPAKLLRWIHLTGGAPAMAGKDPIAHILNLKQNQPDIYQRTFKFLEPIDYLGLRLTGRFAASFDSISLHWLTDNRDINKVRYDERLIRMSDIDGSKLPDLQPANSILGILRPDIAREWGLNENVRVVIGSPDIHSAAIGSGAVRDFETHLYIGTSSWITCHVPFKKTDLTHSIAALPSAIPGRYLLTDAQECAGACLQFLRDNILFHADELTSGSKPQNAYRVFDQIAARIPAGSDKLIFMPWLYGERAPVDDRFVRGGFFNQSLQTTREHMIRAVLEGVAYNSRWLLRYVERLIGRRVEVVNMVGGGAKSDIWCQIHADVMNRPIRQMKDPIEVNVRGAALLASAALGYVRYDDIASCVPVAKTYTPNPDYRRIYDELFREFTAIYKRNKRIFARLNRN